MQDSINTMISNALIVNKDILSKNIKEQCWEWHGVFFIRF